MAREDPQLKLRLTEDLKRRITDEARQNGRSVNAEIVSTLEEKYPPKSISIERVAEFLHALTCGEPDERSKFAESVNDAFTRGNQRWTAKPNGDGTVTFYPYQSKLSDDAEAKTEKAIASIKNWAAEIGEFDVNRVANALRAGDVDGVIRSIVEELGRRSEKSGKVKKVREQTDT